MNKLIFIIAIFMSSFAFSSECSEGFNYVDKATEAYYEGQYYFAYILFSGYFLDDSNLNDPDEELLIKNLLGVACCCLKLGFEEQFEEHMNTFHGIERVMRGHPDKAIKFAMIIYNSLYNEILKERCNKIPFL